MGNQRHRDHGDIDGPLRKSQVISAATRERVQGQVKSIVFLSETARIEQSMRSNLVEFTAQVEQYNSPARVLDALDDAIADDVSLMVLGAKRFGVNLTIVRPSKSARMSSFINQFPRVGGTPISS
jgi:hypothetical protein